ncbi:hypothetical protein GCM10028825_14560 [Spirosoma agri]
MSAQQQDSCSCQANLKALVQIAKDQYAGFEDKVSKKTLSQHNGLLQKLDRQARLISSDKCLPVLEKYIAFFRDGHFTIHFTDQMANLLKPLKAKESLSEINSYLLTKQARLTPIEGTWRDVDDMYRVIVYQDKKDPNLYTGSIASTKVDTWQAGLIKFTLKRTPSQEFEAIYYFRNFTPIHYKAHLQGDILKFSGYGGYWVRTAAKFEDKADLAKKVDLLTRQRQMSNFKFEVIDQNFCYLKISSFAVADSTFNTVLTQHRTIIRQTPYLIIDLRGNAGGCCNFDSWGEFMQLIYTNPFVDSGVSEKVAGKLTSYPGRTIRLDSMISMPKKVALLIDDGGASSTELLLEYAQQSKKVTSFGTPTSGTMDYGTVKPYRLPCGRYEGYVATMRTDWSLHGKIDETGFQPNVFITNDQLDWVKVVMDYYSSQSTTVNEKR